MLSSWPAMSTEPDTRGLTRRGAVLAVAAAASVPALAAATRAVAAPARTHTIIVDKMKFGPAPEGVRVGDTIVWVNNDMFRHTATSRASGFDIDLPPRGGRGQVVMRAAGTLSYLCRFHPNMTGQITVRR